MPPPLIVPATPTFIVPDDLPRRGSVYVDESGNSGPNYCDNAQPFYVLAGWLVPEEREVEVAVAIERFRAKHFSQRDELKAAAILRGDKQKRLCADLFRALGRLHCLPMFLIAEKRYCAAGKVIETFLDPPTNKLLNPRFTMDFETKQELANAVYNHFPYEVLSHFADAYRTPSSNGFKDALDRLTQAAERHLNPELAELFRGAVPHLNEIAAAEAEVAVEGDVFATLNMPCLVSFLMLVENLGRVGLTTPIRLLHDRTHAYEEGYKAIYHIYRGMPRFFAKMPHTELAYTNLENVTTFEVRDSKTSMPIQAADMLAGTIHHLCRIAHGEREATEADRELASLTLPGLLVPEPRLTWMIASERCLQELGRRLILPLARDHIKDKHEAPEARVRAVLAPMLPRVRQSNAEHDAPRFRFEFPLFGCVGTRSRSLLCVHDEEDTDFEPTLLLFSSRQAAERALAWWDDDEWNEPQEIHEFGPTNMSQLIDLMEAAAQHAELLLMDAGTERRAHLKLRQVVADLRAMLSRITRLFSSGMHRVVCQYHDLDGTRVLTMLGSSGRYAAMVPPDGVLYEGTTREDALDRLRSALRATPPLPPSTLPDT